MGETIHICRSKNQEKIFLNRNLVNSMQIIPGPAIYFRDYWERVKYDEYWAETKKKIEETRKQTAANGMKGRSGYYGLEKKYKIFATAEEQAKLLTNDLNKRFEWIFGINNILEIKEYTGKYERELGSDWSGLITKPNKEQCFTILPAKNFFKLGKVNKVTGEKINPNLIKYMNVLGFCLQVPQHIEIQFTTEKVSVKGGGMAASNGKDGSQWIQLSWGLKNFGERGTKLKNAQPPFYTKGCVFLHEFLYHYTLLGHYEFDVKLNGLEGPQVMRDIFKAKYGDYVMSNGDFHKPLLKHRAFIPGYDRQPVLLKVINAKSFLSEEEMYNIYTGKAR